jgi:pyruvate dehydrogenase E1 component beta subunit
MPIDILMPALSPTMEEGTLAKWLKNEGDSVAAGDVIAEIETDKATMEVEAVDEGKIGKIVVPAGTENVKVNAVIAVLLEEGESASDIGSTKKAEPAPEPAAEAPKQEAKSEASARFQQHPSPSADAASDPDIPGRHRDGADDGARSLARRHGRGNAQGRGCLLMGEEVAEYQGAYKITQGLLRSSAPSAWSTHRSPSMVCRRGRRRGHGRASSDCRVHDIQLRHAGDRPDHQLGRQDALHVRRSDGRADRLPRRQWRGSPCRRPALAGYAAWYSHIPGLKVVQPYTGG